MNLMSILSLFLVTIMNIAKSDVASICDENHKNGSFMSAVPNAVFEDINISTVEDLIWQVTQLEITVKPTLEFSNSVGTIVLTSNEEFCDHRSEYSFNFNDRVITIPDVNHKGSKLEPGCNYSIIFNVGKYCTYRYYEIPEPKPCQNYLPENIFNTFPNKIIDNVTVHAFRKNAIRLNILFYPQEEFINHTGYIVLNSKMGRCNHPEEFSFSLIETNLTVPRADYPHSFIDSGCEYMIDFRIGRYCIATEYKVPDFCLGNEPQAEISGVIEETTGIYKILWDPKVFERNKTYSNYSIIDISYRLEDVPYETFNNEMLLENQYHLNYSILDLSRIPKGQNYRLIATFVDDEECSNVSFIEFRVPDDNATILTIIATLTVILVFISVICLYVPTIRAKVVFWFKLVSGVAIKVPTQSTDMKTFGINRREEFSPIYFAFEFPRSRLEIESQKFPPMEGNFGIVYFGRVFALNKTKGFTRVAIKTVRDNAPNEHVEALNEELCTLKKIRSHGNHENVVRMLGCCSLQKPLLIILEYVACGDLKNYLVDLRKEWSNRKSQTRFIFPSNGYGPEINRSISETSSNCIPSPTETESTILSDDADESLLSISITPKKVTPALSNVELQNFALQIAKGMAFLESISVVHRDLAARNVLINEMKILKISDFGMSRVGNYVHRNNGQQPLRWMAPESIEQFLCTSKSDVWSFGIVLWEIGTLGAFPYDSIPNDCILEYLLQSVKKGIRLMRPEICTDELYSLMLKCWSENPDERPSFKEIEEHLSGEKKKIYLDFQKLNPAYVFPPTKQT